MATNWQSENVSVPAIALTSIERVDSKGVPWIRLPDGRRAAAGYVSAVSRESLTRAAQAGSHVVVAQPDNNERPIILGLLASEVPDLPERGGLLEAEVDDRRVTLSGKEEVVLRCGRASITLTRAGKILIRGAYVSSRSSGVNRIKGGSVQIN